MSQTPIVCVEDSPLHVAASEGDVEELALLLRTQGKQVGAFCYDRQMRLNVSPLHVAADAASVRLLLAAGALPDEGERCWTPLHQAARDGRLDAARALLDAGANVVRAHAVTGEHPLHQAAQSGHADLVRLLLERGARLEQAARGGTRPLHHASTAEVLDVLMGAGADLTARDELGATAFDLALQRGDEPSLQRLASARAPRGDLSPLVTPTRARRGLMTFEPMGCEGVLPAVVIGHDISDWRNIPDIQLGLAGSLPQANWFMRVGPQVGGYVMSYPEVLGLMLRLESNVQWARKDPSRWLRGLRAMAEDPDYDLLKREYPGLHSCTGTWGEPYRPEDLSLLHEEISGAFALPEFDGGLEAFVRFKACDLLQVFGGWRVLGLHTPLGVEPVAGGFLYDFLSAHELVRDEDVCLTLESLRALQLYCERFAGARLPPPRAWLVWENSD